MIELKLVCTCGNENALADSRGYPNTTCKDSGVFYLYKDTMYICGTCGLKMKIQVIKKDIKETETIVTEY